MTNTTASTSRIRPPLSLYDLSHRYIIVPAATPMFGSGEYRLAVCNLQSAPAHVFDAFFMRLVNDAGPLDAKFGKILTSVKRSVWNATDRWCVLNALLDRKVAVPLYESKEAAMIALKEQGEK